MHYDRISADCHLDLCWLPPDLFTSRAPAALKDRMPYVTEGPKGPMWVTKKGGTFGLANGMGSAGREYVPGQIHRSDRMASTGLYEDGKKGIRRLSEPELRLKDQDRDGVQAEVLYGILGSSTRMGDPEAAAEMIRIYNDWLADFVRDPPRALHRAGLHPERAHRRRRGRGQARGEAGRRARRRRGQLPRHAATLRPLLEPAVGRRRRLRAAPALPHGGRPHARRHPQDAVGQRVGREGRGHHRLPGGPGRLRRPHQRLPDLHVDDPHVAHLRRRARAPSAHARGHRRGRHRLDPLHPRSHGPGVGGPVRGPRALA